MDCKPVEEEDEEKTITLKEAVEYLDGVKKFMEARGMSTELLKACTTQVLTFASSSKQNQKKITDFFQ